MACNDRLKLRYRKVADLIPYARNARTHSDEQIASLAGIIREFGFLVPLLLDGDGGILAGHGRVLAARKLSMDEVPTIDASHLSEAQRRAFILADNRIAERAGWDREMVKLELLDLQEMGVDLALTAFDASDLKSFFPEDETAPPEDFAGFDEDIEVEHQCPQCGYWFSGGQTREKSQEDIDHAA